MYEALHQRTIRIEVITGEKNSPYCTNTNFPTQSTLNGILDFFTSAVITGVQMGEMSKPIVWTIREMWEDSLYFLHVVIGRRIMSRNIIFVLMYYRHRLLDLI
jgi:hypothetical protein